MSFFAASAQERTHKTWAAATKTRRSLEAANLQLRDIERTLQKIEAELPSGSGGSVMRPVQKTMELTARHADQTLVHLEHLKQHLRTLEEHVRSLRK